MSPPLFPSALSKCSIGCARSQNVLPLGHNWSMQFVGILVGQMSWTPWVCLRDTSALGNHQTSNQSQRRYYMSYTNRYIVQTLNPRSLLRKPRNEATHLVQIILQSYCMIGNVIWLCILSFAATFHCEPRLLKAWADQDKPDDQGDLMAWVGSQM